nr:MAG TPA: Protein of unknown function (DUF1642) [Caudoviricetes sp.]
MMNKGEAVQKLSKVARISVANAEDLYDSFFPKPVVPQYVADWYEEIKDSFGYNLTEAINSIPVPIDGEELSDFEKWLLDDEQALTTLVNMHQFGYEVEGRKRYTVRVKGIDGYTTHLNQNLDNQVWFFASNERIDGFRVRHTRKELEDAGFGWIFSCEGIEVEEVE